MNFWWNKIGGTEARKGRFCILEQGKRFLGAGHPIRKDKGILNMGRLRFNFVFTCVDFVLLDPPTSYCVGHRFISQDQSGVNGQLRSCIGKLTRCEMD